MRFVFFTDPHVSGETPKHRLDDFPAAIIAKLREVYSVAQAEGCSFVACGGDFFNSHRIFHYGLLADVMDILDSFGGRTYTVIGEHDLYGHNLDTYKTSALAFIERRCKGLHVVRESVEPVLGVFLHAKHEPDKLDEAMSRELPKGKVNVLLCHELLSIKKYPYEIVQTAALEGCPYDVVLSGDLHDGFDVHSVGRTIFANPGSLARRTTADAWRMPQIAIVDVGASISVSYRAISCAAKGEDIFGKGIAETARERIVFDGSGFVAGMLAFEAESVDIHELAQKAGRAKGVGDKVLAYLAEKREELKRENAALPV